MSKRVPYDRKNGSTASVCPKCGAGRLWVKHGSHIGPNGFIQHWLQKCLPCLTKCAYETHLKTRDAYREQRKNTPELRANDMLYCAKDRAKKKGLPYNLTKEFVVSKLKIGICPVTGLSFDMTMRPLGERSQLVPTIDRKDPKIGYTIDNCQVVCWLYNRAKGDGTHADVMKLAEALVALDRKTTPTV